MCAPRAKENVRGHTHKRDRQDPTEERCERSSHQWKDQCREQCVRADAKGSKRHWSDSTRWNVRALSDPGRNHDGCEYHGKHSSNSARYRKPQSCEEERAADDERRGNSTKCEHGRTNTMRTTRSWMRLFCAVPSSARLPGVVECQLRGA